MKKFLLIITTFFILPAWALCPVGDGESVCSISNGNSASAPLFQNSSAGIKGANKTGLNNMQNSFKSSNTGGSSFGRTQNQNGIQMEGSLGCQFGNCNNKGNDFLKNQ